MASTIGRLRAGSSWPSSGTLAASFKVTSAHHPDAMIALEIHGLVEAAAWSESIDRSPPAQSGARITSTSARSS